MEKTAAGSEQISLLVSQDRAAVRYRNPRLGTSSMIRLLHPVFTRWQTRTRHWSLGWLLTFEALKRGAAQVVAIDDFSDYLGTLDQSQRMAWKTFDFCRDALGYDMQRCPRIDMSVYDLDVNIHVRLMSFSFSVPSTICVTLFSHWTRSIDMPG